MSMVSLRGFKDAVQCFGEAVVFSVAHILVIQVNDFLTESVDGELCDTRLPSTGRSVQERRISSPTVVGRAEHMVRVLTSGSLRFTSQWMSSSRSMRASVIILY